MMKPWVMIAIAGVGVAFVLGCAIAAVIGLSVATEVTIDMLTNRGVPLWRLASQSQCF